MSEEIITFDSSGASNAYLAQRAIDEIKESDRQFNEIYWSILISDACSALRECEESYRRSNGKVRTGSIFDHNCNYLQTTSLTEFKNYMLINRDRSFSHDNSYFAIFSSYEISCGYPSDDMFRYADKEKIHWIPESKIPDYGKRIVLFGDNLKFLYPEQAEALTYPQLAAIVAAIKDGKINKKSLKGTPLDKILKQFKKGKTELPKPPMEMEGGCCIIE